MKKLFLFFAIISIQLCCFSPAFSVSFEEATKRAAEQGNANAQLTLGIMYNLGEGVPQDFAKAHQWFERAAEAGAGGRV